MEKPFVNNDLITIDTAGPQGNAFFIMGKVSSILRENGKSDLITQYTKEATSSDYENLKNVSKKYINIEFK